MPSLTGRLRAQVFVKGALLKPGDSLVFVRKDHAVSGVDTDTGTGLANVDDQANCDDATHGNIPTSIEGQPPKDSQDYGGTLRRDCKTTATECDPATCVVYPENDPNYHADCRYATEFLMFGKDDTIDPDRHPHQLPAAGVPSSPPWFDSLTDTHHDNGGTNNNALVAGTGQTDVTYEETGTWVKAPL